MATTIRPWSKRRRAVSESIDRAVALALSYISGLKETCAAGSAAEARAFREHLADQGYVVRPRNGERRRLKSEPLEKRRISGAEIRAMRVALDMSLAGLSARSGIRSDTLAHIESGRTSPQARTVAAILNALAEARADPDRPR